MIEGSGRKGDVLIGLSTSGNSKNVIEAILAAKEKGMICVSLTGAAGVMGNISDYVLAVPSKDTPRIQECHGLLGHIICEIVEAELFPCEK